MYTNFHQMKKPVTLTLTKSNGFFHLVFLSSLIILNSNAYYVFHY